MHDVVLEIVRVCSGTRSELPVDPHPPSILQALLSKPGIVLCPSRVNTVHDPCREQLRSHGTLDQQVLRGARPGHHHALQVIRHRWQRRGLLPGASRR